MLNWNLWFFFVTKQLYIRYHKKLNHQSIGNNFINQQTQQTLWLHSSS